MMHDDFDSSFDGFDDSPSIPAYTPKRKKVAKTTAEREANLAAFKRKHENVVAWMVKHRFEFGFAANMYEAVQAWGDLTPGQMDATLKCVEREASYKERENERFSTAPAVDTGELWGAFKRGVTGLYLAANGREFKIYQASKHGKNAGALYVTCSDVYFGKIVGEKFMPAKACTAEDEADIYLAIETPLASAVAYGKLTGRCSCCNRELTNPESVELGIGPICRAKFFG